MSKYWTVGGVETRGIVGSHPVITPGEETVFSLRFTPRQDDHLEAYEELRDYLDYAEQQAHGTYLTGQPWYRELHERDTLVLEFEPGSESQAAQGVWGLVTGGSDNTVRPRQEALLTLEVFVLGTTDEYATLSEVEAAFKIETDVATYTSPDVEEGPFIGDADEPGDDKTPGETQDDVEDNPTDEAAPTFTVTESDLTIEFEDDRGEAISQTIQVSVENDLGETILTGSTQSSQITVPDLRNGSYEVEAEADLHRRQRQEFTIQGEDKTVEFVLDRLPGADDVIDQIEAHHPDFADYQAEVAGFDDYLEHEDWLVDTVGVDSADAESFTDRGIEHIGGWLDYQDFVTEEAESYDDLRDAMRDERLPGEGDIGDQYAGVEIHSSPGRARDDEFINVSNWVEIFGAHIHHARVTEVDPDRANFAVNLWEPPDNVAHDTTVEIEVRIENTGTTSATKEVSIEVDGVQEDSDDVSVDPGSIAFITLTWDVPNIGGSINQDVTLTAVSPDDQDSHTVTIIGVI